MNIVKFYSQINILFLMKMKEIINNSVIIVAFLKYFGTFIPNFPFFVFQL